MPYRSVLFNVDAADVQKCYTFAKSICDVSAATEKNFGGEIRDPKQNIANHMLGKAGEIAFKSLLHHHSITANIDWEIRKDKLKTDGGNEFTHYGVNGNQVDPKCKLDVKSSSALSQWLLVEKSKMFRYKDHVPADLFVGVTWTNSEAIPNFLLHPEEALKKTMSMKIRGFANKSDLVNKNGTSGWIQFPEKQRLIKPSELEGLKSLHCIENKDADFEKFKAALQIIEADPKTARIGPKLENMLNTGLPYSWLRTSNDDWDRLVSQLVSDSESPRSSSVQ